MNPDGLPSLGATLAGKYRLTRELGRGGMGVVYEATHLRLEQRVAIKIVLPQVARRPELAQRFAQEARATARLKGRHTVRVLDVDATPEGLPFLVMEFLEGHTLRDELLQRGPLPVADAVRYVREACEGIEEAHRAGIIHRDLKPANLFLSVESAGDVIVKVVDFGVAKSVGPDDGHLTATNVHLGTYKFMSPEQIRSARSVDARTDIWALGVVLYQLLTGKTPFRGPGAVGVALAITTQPPPPLRVRRPDAPEALVAILERALSKDPDGRHASARELSDDLAPFGGPDTLARRERSLPAIALHPSSTDLATVALAPHPSPPPAPFIAPYPSPPAMPSAAPDSEPDFTPAAPPATPSPTPLMPTAALTNAPAWPQPNAPAAFAPAAHANAPAAFAPAAHANAPAAFAPAAHANTPATPTATPRPKTPSLPHVAASKVPLSHPQGPPVAASKVPLAQPKGSPVAASRVPLSPPKGPPVAASKVPLSHPNALPHVAASKVPLSYANAPSVTASKVPRPHPPGLPSASRRVSSPGYAIAPPPNVPDIPGMDTVAMEPLPSSLGLEPLPAAGALPHPSSLGMPPVPAAPYPSAPNLPVGSALTPAFTPSLGSSGAAKHTPARAGSQPGVTAPRPTDPARILNETLPLGGAESASLQAALRHRLASHSEAPSESVTQGAKAQVVSINPAAPPAGLPISPRWLLGGVVSLALGAGIAMGINAARSRPAAGPSPSLAAPEQPPPLTQTVQATLPSAPPALRPITAPSADPAGASSAEPSALSPAAEPAHAAPSASPSAAPSDRAGPAAPAPHAPSAPPLPSASPPFGARFPCSGSVRRMILQELPSVGDTLLGKYRLGRELGRGGMGVVYEAMHLRMGQKVAIKVLLPTIAQRPELTHRFEREARAAARLRGRHTVRVHDVDETPAGLPFLVMEFLEGHSLRDELARHRQLPIADAVRYAREACEGVDEAHRAGIIHRDLKPANLFLSVGGGERVVKVVDFGIAKTLDATSSDFQTATNTPLGTHRYMSPEQARSPRSVDVRSDVWSLGVVLYQLLSGRTPFSGEGAAGIVFAIATQPPRPLRSLRADVPEALVAVIERTLSKDPDGRHASARELSDALAPFGDPPPVERRLSLSPDTEQRRDVEPDVTPLPGSLTAGAETYVTPLPGSLTLGPGGTPAAPPAPALAPWATRVETEKGLAPEGRARLTPNEPARGEYTHASTMQGLAPAHDVPAPAGHPGRDNDRTQAAPWSPTPTWPPARLAHEAAPAEDTLSEKSHAPQITSAAPPQAPRSRRSTLALWFVAGTSSLALGGSITAGLLMMQARSQARPATAVSATTAPLEGSSARPLASPAASAPAASPFLETLAGQAPALPSPAHPHAQTAPPALSAPRPGLDATRASAESSPDEGSAKPAARTLGKGLRKQPPALKPSTAANAAAPNGAGAAPATSAPKRPDVPHFD